MRDKWAGGADQGNAAPIPSRLNMWITSNTRWLALSVAPAIATFAVGQTLYLNVAAPPGRDGTSWQNAYRPPQGALEGAAGFGGAVTRIRLALGTYNPTRGTCDRTATFSMQSDPAVHSGFAGRRVVSNRAQFGGALHCHGSSPIFAGCTFHGDPPITFAAGALWFKQCSPTSIPSNRRSYHDRADRGAYEAVEPHCVRGDLSCAGLAGFADSNPFIVALTDPGAYSTFYSECSPLNGECNCDGQTGFQDISPSPSFC